MMSSSHRSSSFILEALIYSIWCQSTMVAIIFYALCRNACIAGRILASVRLLEWNLRINRLLALFAPEKAILEPFSQMLGLQLRRTYIMLHSSNDLFDSKMSSAEVLRGSIQPLGINTSMNIQRNENTPSVGSNMSSFLQNGQDRVPIDRPLFVNTSMSAQNRIDLYRRLDDPPQDSEPALLFRLP
uniref:Bestrophin homolog n=2 Tax=Haemonchus contortus TaxID=6289 RepID=A0A7I4Z661_HAECO